MDCGTMQKKVNGISTFSTIQMTLFGGLPLFWGHATSNDLTHWQDEPVAIAPKRNDSGAYSGSMVIDHNNTSGFFNDTVDPRQRCVAIWTYNTQKVKNNTLAIPLMVVTLLLNTKRTLF
ncbi:BMC_2a_G0032100.mRNA.1.CDS.1 [Saccharomyces cerevisiae]|nr:BMC_2a_G0032100.mRNA.1.CDS.1 [Saccharomyces cerevisiae]CAI7248456.1 BMC_2a_G0032100.mRNA.1.CDS.1 [Saccharomyces cerevisiae]